MTPTPEEVNNESPFDFFKRKIYQHNSLGKYGSGCAECNFDRLSISIFNEAMEELYKDRIEKAGSDLPDYDAWVLWVKECDKRTGSRPTPLETYTWLKKQASVVIAKVKNDYEEVLTDNRKLVRKLDVIINGKEAAKQASLCDIVSQLRSVLEQKDKEIEKEKGAYEDLASTSLETMNELKKEIEELKASIIKILYSDESNLEKVMKMKQLTPANPHTT